jgi:hypothetical protein
MKKLIALVAVVLVAGVVGASAQEATPVKLSLLPGISIPASKTVHGLDLGILATSINEVQGVQLAWIYGKTEKLVGVQSAFVEEADDVTGVQWGFYNGAKSVTGVQLGFINVTEQMNGVQLGLVNVIKKSPLFVMVFANAYF